MYECIYLSMSVYCVFVSLFILSYILKNVLFYICGTQNFKKKLISALYSKTGFSQTNGGRPGAAKVLVVVTDGESHDNDMRDAVIAECEKQGITRFGIAVSTVGRAIVMTPQLSLFTYTVVIVVLEMFLCFVL